MKRKLWLGAVALAIVALVAAACGKETVTVIEKVEVPGETIIVEKEIVKEVQVPGETIIVEKEVIKTVEVIKEVQVPGETIIVEKQIVKEVQVPGETIIVEKQIVKEVQVPGETIIIEKEVIKTVEVEVIREVIAPREEKVLRVRMANMPPAFNFHTVGSGALTVIAGWIYSHLVQVGPATGKWAPDLAAGWEVSADGTEWTFFLQKGAVWHDGMPVTTKDVAFSIKSFLNPQMSGWMLSNYLAVKGALDFQEGRATEVSGIQIIDDYTIKLVMDQPNVTLLDEINGWNGGATPVLPEHLLKDIPADQIFEHKYWSEGLVGSGPFKLVSYVPQQAMVLEANDDFYFGRPKIDKIILVIIGSADATQIALQRGEVDITVRGGVSLAANKQFLQDTRFDVYATEAGLITTFAWNQRIDRLRDPRIREAFWIAIDEVKLCDRFRGGLCTQYGSQLVQSWVYLPEWDTRFTYDPDKARQLMIDAGYSVSKPLIITTEQRPSTDPERRAELAIRQQMLAEVGIKFDIKEVDAAAGQSKWYDTLDAEVVGHSSSSRTDPALKMFEFFSGGDTNPFGMDAFVPGFFPAIELGSKITDLAARAAYFQKFNEEYLWKYLPQTNIRQDAKVKVKNKRFYMPVFGDIPKVVNFKDMPIYPIHANRDDNWVYHVEQWEIRD